MHVLKRHDIICVKSVRIRSFYSPYFPAYGLNTERYGVSLRIEGKYGTEKLRLQILFTQWLFAPNREYVIF